MRSVNSLPMLTAEQEKALKEKLEKERQERLEEERKQRALEEKNRLLAEALERDARLQEQLVRTREENNKMFCQKPLNYVGGGDEGEGGAANPFFVARANNVVNLTSGSRCAC